MHRVVVDGHRETVSRMTVQRWIFVGVISSQRRARGMFCRVLRRVIGTFVCAGNTQRPQVGRWRIIGGSRWGGEAARAREDRLEGVLPRVSARRIVAGLNVGMRRWFGQASMFGRNLIVVG